MRNDDKGPVIPPLDYAGSSIPKPPLAPPPQRTLNPMLRVAIILLWLAFVLWIGRKIGLSWIDQARFK